MDLNNNVALVTGGASGLLGGLDQFLPDWLQNLVGGSGMSQQEVDALTPDQREQEMMNFFN